MRSSFIIGLFNDKYLYVFYYWYLLIKWFDLFLEYYIFLVIIFLNNCIFNGLKNMSFISYIIGMLISIC